LLSKNLGSDSPPKSLDPDPIPIYMDVNDCLEHGGAWHSWIFLYIIISQRIRNLVGRNWWLMAFLDFPLYNYFSADTEPSRKELVAHSVPGFSSV
jgi:hypothetical protein